MTPSHQHTDRKDSPPRFTPLALLYLPFVLIIVGVARFAVRAGIIRFEPPAAVPRPRGHLGLYNNRYFRRAQAACIRKEYTRIKMTGRPMTGLNYFPRRYAFMGFENLTTNTQTFQQYLNQCVRKFGLSRTVLFGLIPTARVTTMLKNTASSLSMITVLTPSLNLAAPSDPAPP